jgi:hypothetical protein
MNTSYAFISPIGDDLSLANLREINDRNFLFLLPNVEQLVREKLWNFVRSPDFSAKMKVAFGEEIDVTQLQAAWAAGDFSRLPAIEVRSRSQINGANGAYARAIDTFLIYQFTFQQIQIFLNLRPLACQLMRTIFWRLRTPFWEIWI